MPPTLININIGNDADNTRFEDGFASSHNYQDNVPNPAFDDQLPEDPGTNPREISNPENKKAHAKRRVIEIIQGQIKAAERIADEAAKRVDFETSYVEPDIT